MFGFYVPGGSADHAHFQAPSRAGETEDSHLGAGEAPLQQQSFAEPSLDHTVAAGGVGQSERDEGEVILRRDGVFRRFPVTDFQHGRMIDGIVVRL